VGDSIPYWAGERAQARGRPDMDLPGGASVSWMAVRGMGWQGAIHQLQIPVLFQAPPQVLLLYLGGNDLVAHSLRHVLKLVRETVEYLRSAFPEVALVWVNILPRFKWRAPKDEYRAINNKLKRVNQFGRSMMREEGGRVLDVNIDLKTLGFYRPDGVHLSDVGLDMYLDAIRELLLDMFE